METKVGTNDINELKQHIIILENQIRQNQRRQINRESCLTKCIKLKIDAIIEQLPNIDKAKIDLEIENEINEFKIKSKKLSDENLKFIRNYYERKNESIL